MKTNDYRSITTRKQLRAALTSLYSDIATMENTYSVRLDNLRRILSLRKFLLFAIGFLRNAISGTPFAKS